ncbi:translation machinery-associated protein 16 [Cladophialophora chaetospira]|uniref:Translation machinery-associated protein 16 n=1 Tax=Cladophialophora chaetospira TaxID=386627 RepID=A0AA39CD63_9EURO|nr:translation machinery-associated protein 16 [Cladophialophora chaetospira]
MARSLNKVQKKISKKRGGKPTALHENSRDAQRLRRAGGREEKLARLLDAAVKSNQVYGKIVAEVLCDLDTGVLTPAVDRVAWFKAALEGSSGPLSDDEMHILTQSFIGREDDELAEAKKQRRPGRPPTKTEERISQRKDAEDRESRGGFWVPELRDEESRLKVERWTGDWGGLNTLSFVRVVKSGPIKPSSFPPKAGS